MRLRVIFTFLLLALGLATRPATAGSREVLVSAAHIGGYGLELTIGSECSGPDHLVLGAPDSPATGVYDGCVSVTATNLTVSGAGATFRAANSITLGNGFEVANGSDFAAALVPEAFGPFVSVLDESPIAETAYVAKFYLRLDDLTLGAADEFDHLVAFATGGAEEFRVTVTKPAGTHLLSLAARQDGGGWTSTAPGQEISLAADWNEIDLSWLAADGSGQLLIAVNGAGLTGLTGLTNSTRLVESIRWGVVSGALDASNGMLQIDGFDSWR